MIALSGVHLESTQTPPGVDTESLRSPHGLTRSLNGLQADPWGSVNYSIEGQHDNIKLKVLGTIIPSWQKFLDNFLSTQLDPAIKSLLP